MHSCDWGLIRSFLAVAQFGSLSAAARELGVSQPTLSRDIQALEGATSLNLFRRTTQGLQLTDTGQTLMEAAARMNVAAEQFARQTVGLSAELAGDVRLAVNEVIGCYWLPPALAELREQHPDVNIEVVVSNAVSSLSKREADIALRMFRPTQPDLVAKRLPDIPLGFFASRDYLAKHGMPMSFDECRNHTLIGFDAATEFVDEAARQGYALVRDNFALRTDNLPMQINLIRAGAGIGVTHVQLAAQWSNVVRVMPNIALPDLEFWLVCHRDVQHNSRISAVMKFLTAWFEADAYRNVLT